MKRVPLIAVLLIVLGIAAFVYGGIGAPGMMASTIGPLDAMAPPPFLGVLAVAGGIAFLIAARASGAN